MSDHSTTLLLIHGMWSTPDTLSELSESLTKEGYQVETPRLPHHFALSDMDKVQRHKLLNCELNDYVDAITEQVNSLSQPVVLVGHSMGGLIAQLVAASVDVKGIVLLSSAAPAGINSWTWSGVRTLGKNLFRFPLWKSLTMLSLDNIRYGIANTQSPETQQHIYTQSTYESGLASWQIANWFLYSNPPSKVDFDAIECPALVIGGQLDKVTPITIQQRIESQLKNSTLVTLPNACHWTIGGSHLADVKQTIVKWLREQGI